jgi:hypothetical protein
VIGDSYMEIDAGVELYSTIKRQCDCTLLKTVKMICEPTPEELIEQLYEVNQQWHAFVQFDSSLDAFL